MNTDIKSKEILSKLKSRDSAIVLQGIEKIRESGNRYVLSEMIDLLHDTKQIEIKKSILNLISELKDKESIPVLIAAIQNEKYYDERTELVACCWQNGLSYNVYLPVFIDLVINEVFLIAFEAFTVIENLYGNIDDQVIENEILKIEEAMKTADEQKTYLLNGLLTIIRDIPEQLEFTE